MHWHSVSDFLSMGGYGLYVWVSFGGTALCMVAEVLTVRNRSKHLREAREDGSPWTDSVR